MRRGLNILRGSFLNRHCNLVPAHTILRLERRRAEREGGTPRTLREIDFLLMVDDEARQGALRFVEHEGGPFLREEGVKRIPPVIELPELLVDGIGWGSSDKDARFLSNFRRIPGRVEEKGRKPLMPFPQKIGVEAQWTDSIAA